MNTWGEFCLSSQFLLHTKTFNQWCPEKYDLSLAKNGVLLVKQYSLWVRLSKGPLSGPPLPVFFTVLITLSPFIALTTQNTANAHTHTPHCNLWCCKLCSIRHTGDRKWRRNERKQKKRACWTRLMRFGVNPHCYQHMAGLIVCRKQRTTQEIQLKEKTQGSDEILNITNLAIVPDQD